MGQYKKQNHGELNRYLMIALLIPMVGCNSIITPANHVINNPSRLKVFGI
jgi:hypothetical protein